MHRFTFIAAVIFGMIYMLPNYIAADEAFMSPEILELRYEIEHMEREKKSRIDQLDDLEEDFEQMKAEYDIRILEIDQEKSKLELDIKDTKYKKHDVLNNIESLIMNYPEMDIPSIDAALMHHVWSYVYKREVERFDIINQTLMNLADKRKDLNKEKEALIAEMTDKEIEKETYINDVLTLADDIETKIEQQQDIRLNEKEELGRQRIEEEERVREERRKASDSDGSMTASINIENIEGNGEYLWPVPSSKRITSEFGYRTHPISGEHSFHSGLDIGASQGDDIVAVDHGSIVLARYQGGYGNTVVIDHGDGLRTLYAHMRHGGIHQEGQEVNRGEKIGEIGSTGNSTGPHLHIEFLEDGVPQDPGLYLNK